MKTKKFDPSKPIVLPMLSANGGPNTEAGRAISSRNATKHGCCSTETLILATESQEEFKSLQSAWFQTYQPKLEAEVHLVRQLIEADWFNQRSTRTVAEVEAYLFKTTPNPADWTEAQQKTLTRFLRYQTTRNNILIKSRKAVGDYRKNRAAELLRTQNLKDKADKRAIAEAKAKIYQSKHAPINWPEKLEQMRQQAISLAFTPKQPFNPTLK